MSYNSIVSWFGQHPRVGVFSALGAALGGNFFLAFLFYRALTNPSEYIEFLVRASATIFIIEFLNIHSSAMLLGLRRKQYHDWRRFFKIPIFSALFILYVYAANQWGGALGNFSLPAVFAVSLATKFFDVKASGRDSMVFPLMATFLVTLVLAGVAQSFWQEVFPFPEEVYRASRQVGWACFSGKEKAPVPCEHWLPVWGLLYYSAVAFIDFVFFTKRGKEGLKSL